MLLNLKEILAIAEEKKCAVGAFNTPNLECLLAVIDAAEKLDVPVIISHAQLHEKVAPMSKNRTGDDPGRKSSRGTGLRAPGSLRDV